MTSRHTPPRALMIQGTGSNVGKSMLVAGLCRAARRRGLSVAPFKPQNMSNNAAVTADGGEIGRAQALQAIACGLPAHTDMNPVLLKPETDVGSQVVVQGKRVATVKARDYAKMKPALMKAVLDSFNRLKSKNDLVLVEGAGSPAEVNLRAGDIANMGFARASDCPVILTGDIDRGGVFAHLTGTVNILSASEQERIKGFLINKFRGRIELLQDDLDWLEDYSQKPVLGVLPYIMDLRLDAEDGINRTLHEENLSHSDQQRIVIKVPVLPRISNHTDFEPLLQHSGVVLEYVTTGGDLSGADLIILPGSKSVQADLAYLREQGFDRQVFKHLRFGGKVLGICGGFQMLGQKISDPEQIEGSIAESEGLGLLDISTRLTAEKQLKNVLISVIYPYSLVTTVWSRQLGHDSCVTTVSTRHY